MATMQLLKAASSPLRLAGTPELMARLGTSETTQNIELYTFQYPFEGPPLSQICADHYRFLPNVSISTDDISLLRFFANSGKGLALMPEIGVLEDMKAGRVVCADVPGNPSIDIFVITLIQRWAKESVDTFLEGFRRSV